jgi:hypothetical protein
MTDARPSPYSIMLNARPVRVAFIVDSTNCPADLLDDLFKVNYLDWGGRLRPIVPAENGALSNTYRRLLSGADPDIVYAYCDLDPAEIDWIDRKIQPWSLIQHRLRPVQPGERPDYRPNLSFRAVSAKEAMVGMFGSRWPAQLVPTLFTSHGAVDWPYQRWFARNFGLQRPEGVPESISTWHQVVVENDWTDTRILRQLSAVTYPAIPACAAAARSKFFRPRELRNDSTYCLVVGDTASDWLMFWNQVFTLTPYQWSRWHTLCVAPDRFDDVDFVAALQAFLRRHGTRSGNNPPDFFLRSSSVGEDALRQISERIGAGRLDLIRRIEHLQVWSIRAVREEERDTFPILEWPWRGEGPETIEQQAISNRVLLQTPPSDIALSGDWVLDLNVEFQARHKFFSNEQLWWMLPKRIQLPQLFVQRQGRVNRGGSLSYAMGERSAVELSIPSEESVLRVALADKRRGHLADADLRQQEGCPFEDFRLSDKGKYLDGVIELLGGLQGASSFFGNSFWRGVVEHVCNRSPHGETATVERIRNKLRKQRTRLLNDLGHQDFDSIAQRVLSIARAEPTRDTDLTWDWLEARFIKQRRTYVTAHPDYLQGIPNDDLAIQPSGLSREEENAAKELRDSLQEHVAAGVFFQGVRYRCHACGLAFWRSIHEASRTVDCEGCRTSVPIRVESSWAYRLNTLVRNAVAYHGTIPVIWTLTNLRRIGRSIFLYSPGLALFRAWDDATASAELDVACIRDGKLVIGEVKTAHSEFDEECLRRLGETASALVADVVVLAAFRGDQARMQTIAQRLEQRFPVRSFSVEAFAPNADINDPTPDVLSSHWEIF